MRYSRAGPVNSNVMSTLDPTLLALFTFAVGLLIGHRLSLGREKRKEFNEAVQPFRTIFLAESENPSAYRELPARSELDLMLQLMLPWKRRGFRKTLDAFHQAKCAAEVRNELGGVLYNDTTAICDIPKVR